MLTDLREMLDAPILTLPIGGRIYVITSCTAEVWLRLQEINERVTDAAVASKDGSDVATATGVTDLEMYKLALGDTFAEMLAGGVTATELRHAGVTAYYWQLGNEAVAEAMWESAGKAPAATPAPPRKTSTRTSTAAATTTRKRASGNGTSSPKK